MLWFEAARAALRSFATAKERAERLLTDAQATIKDFETKLGHERLARDEAIQRAEADVAHKASRSGWKIVTCASRNLSSAHSRAIFAVPNSERAVCGTSSMPSDRQPFDFQVEARLAARV
jgi:hypothetical protein